jgi:hypothetical protein
MIPLKFGLFWSGTNLSFLRFLTFVSLRKHHPNAEIELWVSSKSNSATKWKGETQDFQRERESSDSSYPICYISELEALDIKVIKKDLFPTYAPNYQSDFFRWWWLYNNGGFYLDTDQIILKPFNDLLGAGDFIYSMYGAISCGIYSPVGVIGSKKHNHLIKEIMFELPNCYDANNYNSLGPFMFREIFNKNSERWAKKCKLFNAPPSYFYPFAESRLIKNAYNSNIHLTGESYALHWFGGHNTSQEFNKSFTEQSLFENEDTISLLSRPLVEYWRGL